MGTVTERWGTVTWFGALALDIELLCTYLLRAVQKKKSVG